MDRDYWLARERASANLATLACSIEARLTHLEFARLYRWKRTMIEEGETPTAAHPEEPIAISRNRRATQLDAPAERRWSTQELAVLRCLTANGESIADIAVRMRRTKQSIEKQSKTEPAMA